MSAIVTKKLAAAKLRTELNQKTTAHYFRHYFARAAYNSGAPVDKIAKTLDHATICTTEDNYLSRDVKKENDVSEFVVIPGFEEQNGDMLTFVIFTFALAIECWEGDWMNSFSMRLASVITSH